MPTRHLRTVTVLRVEEDRCEVTDGDASTAVAFAPPFPSPRVERVHPGHLVAVAAEDGHEVVVWRWFDAVVLDRADGGLLLWEPGHGEVTATPRDADRVAPIGSRVYASAGLPGADWWVAGPVTTRPEDADVELDAVDALFTDAGLWPAAFAAVIQSSLGQPGAPPTPI